MSHLMNVESESAHRQMLSGHVQLPEFLASRVGMLCGGAISRCMLTMRSKRGFSMWSGLLRWLFVLGSQVLWCQLKSPRRRSSVALWFRIQLFSLVAHTSARVLMV